MKKNTQGSLLIWTLFLMFFVLSSFFYMSLRIKTKIQAPNIEQTESQNPVMTQKIFQNSFS
jgi:hypothetical protein